MLNPFSGKEYENNFKMSADILTFKAPITTAADDNNLFFRVNKT